MRTVVAFLSGKHKMALKTHFNLSNCASES